MNTVADDDFRLTFPTKKISADASAATNAYTGFRKVFGGVIPNRISRIIPPPTAVQTPRTKTPKMSIRLCTAITAPDKANATVPTISTKKTIVSASSILTHPLSCYYFIRFACPWQRRKNDKNSFDSICFFSYTANRNQNNSFG